MKKGREDFSPRPLKEKAAGWFTHGFIEFYEFLLLNAPGKPILISAKIKPKKEKGGKGTVHVVLFTLKLFYGYSPDDFSITR